MKTAFLPSLIFVAVIFTLTACNSGKTADTINTSDSTKTATIEYKEGLTDLKDFPTEWIMLTNITPDSIIANYVVMYDTDSAYYGTAKITSENGVFKLAVKNYLEAFNYEIKSCKKVNEAEMIYYNFELVDTGNKTAKKLQINYRENSQNPQSSVWSFAGESDMEFISAELSKQFKPYYNQDEY